MLAALKPWFKFGTLLALIWLVLFSLRLCHLHTEASIKNKTKQANEQSEEPKPKTETQQLFENIISQENFVNIEPDSRIILPAKDFILVRKVNDMAFSEKEETLLERLYQSIAGKAVQQQVKYWNHSRRFAAVRDNLPASGITTETRWKVRNHWDENEASTPWVPLSYGYINNGKLQPNFNDWISVAGMRTLTFTSEFNLAKKKTIQIQVIGQPDISKLSGKKSLLACQSLSSSEIRSGNSKSCRKVKTIEGDVSAYVITLHLPAGKHTLTIPISPAINQEKQLEGLPIYQDKNNQFAWEPIREHHRDPIKSEDKNYHFVIKTHDGKALTQIDDARPTRFTRDNGLVTLVGYERSDRYALSGLLARSQLPRDNTEVRLTIDSQLQKLAQKHLEKEIPTLGGNKAFAQKRKASVVIMNPETGAILAAANYPNPLSGIHHWDRISFSKLYPNLDPFGVNAWQGLDNHNAPGSTFKTVTALAALQAADEGREDLEEMIEGLSASQFKQHTGLSVHDYSYQPDADITTKVNNAGHAPLAGSLPYKGKNGSTIYPSLRIAKNGGVSGCPSRAVRSKNLGLREAVRDSLNIWFARLGVMMDENNLETGGLDTHLAGMSRTLGFDSIVSLAHDTDSLFRIPGGKGRGDVLNAYTGSLSLDNAKLIKREQRLLSEGKIETNSALQRLTQNSFGQGVSTTPLQMARITASIATGYIPDPYLIEKWDGDIIDAPDRRRLKIDQIDYLHQGMKAVTETGTAKHAFKRFYPNGQCRTFGKTGTAQLGRGEKKSPFNTAWFVGWQNDKNNKPKLSFACMVTHAYAKGKDSGGTVCAPIIARILNDVDKLNKKKGAE